MRKSRQKGLSPIAVIVLIALAIGGYLLYSGKISLNQKSNIQTTTLPSTSGETANWKTYTSSKHGYSLKYPNEWSYVLGKGTEDQVVFENMAVVVTVTDGSEKPAIKSDGRNKATENRQINIGGVSGEQATVLDTPTGNISYIQSAVIHDSKTYYFNLQRLNQRLVYDQMLSSFKFLDQNQTDMQTKNITLLPTFEWKEVSLSGLSFKIPAEARLQTGGYSGRENMGAVWGLIYLNDKDTIPSKVSVEKYNGESRRDQFLTPFDNQEKIIKDCKLIFEEAAFGLVKALQIPHSDSSCPSGIMTVVGDKLVIFHDLYYNFEIKTITRTPEIDTIISTLK